MECDVLVVGAGMAGAAAAYELADPALGLTIVVAEREDVPGYHSTGRSASIYTESYGAEAIRALTVASRPFFERPPEGFGPGPLLTPRGVLHVGRADQVARIGELFESCRKLSPGIRRLDGDEARRLFPALAPGYAAAAVLEPEARDMDVNGIHQGYLRGLKARGGSVLTGAEVLRCERGAGRWRVTTAAASVSARWIVNAAGAWADELAGRAGLKPLGLTPRRRTAIVFDAPDGLDCARWPLMIDVGETFYVKPESGRLLGSPADETPVAAQDIQPDEIDVALAVDRIERATTFRITCIVRKWAGLRSFLADHVPAAGADPAEPTFVWLAGQGGYGIMTAPALARWTAALIAGADMPADMTALGLKPTRLDPARFLRPGT